MYEKKQEKENKDKQNGVRIEQKFKDAVLTDIFLFYWHGHLIQWIALRTLKKVAF